MSRVGRSVGGELLKPLVIIQAASDISQTKTGSAVHQRRQQQRVDPDCEPGAQQEGRVPGSLRTASSRATAVHPDGSVRTGSATAQLVQLGGRPVLVSTVTEAAT
jgi:hypothetical protein